MLRPHLQRRKTNLNVAPPPSKKKEKDVAPPQTYQEENKLDFAICKEEKTNLNCSRPPTKERKKDSVPTPCKEEKQLHFAPLAPTTKKMTIPVSSASAERVFSVGIFFSKMSDNNLTNEASKIMHCYALKSSGFAQFRHLFIFNPGGHAPGPP